MNSTKAGIPALALSFIMAITFLGVLTPSTSVRAADFTVTSTGDTLPDGAEGELRWAIKEANKDSDKDAIIFNIGGGGDVQTITPSGPLPAIIHPVEIAGSTQLGEPGIGIKLDGTSAGASAEGLEFQSGASASVVEGLAVYSFDGFGIYLNQSDNVTVRCCHVGTDTKGTDGLLGNATGIYGYSIDNCIIGGKEEVDRNVISGNTSDGVYLSGSTNNTILENNIGTDIEGTGDLGNGGCGVFSYQGSSNTIGTGNVISGNGSSGIKIENATGTEYVKGNYIGLDKDGNGVLANSQGVETGDNCVIGGSTAGDRNVISGNTYRGVMVKSGGSGNHILGNFIGTDAGGSLDRGNGGSGIASSGHAGENIIGGPNPGEGNVISGNGYGIALQQDEGCTIQGNFIGLNAGGDAALGNDNSGIYMYDGPDDIYIGGDTPGERNVISGNGAHGIYMATGGGDIEIYGNYIGTDAGGNQAFGNAGQGIYVGEYMTDVYIGGGTEGQGNVISGNTQNGVNIDNSYRVYVHGNHIGTNAGGTEDLGNQHNGVLLQYGADDIHIGGPGAGEGNLISGNDNFGIVLSGVSASSVKGNYIGTDVTGTQDLGNSYQGVSFQNGSKYNTVGGTAAGDRNLISGNNDPGIGIDMCDLNTIQGNYIGTDASGSGPLGNGRQGIYVYNGSDSNTIGGSSGAGNLIRFNGADGLLFQKGGDLNDPCFTNEASYNTIWNNNGSGVEVGTGGYQNRMSHNSIYGNGSPGILLSGDGNHNYEAPGFAQTTYWVVDGTATVTGTAPPGAEVEIFKTGETPDPSGAGQGKSYLGTTTATGGSFSTTVSGVSGGDSISAVAICPTGDPNAGDTSQFGDNARLEWGAPTVNSVTPSTGFQGEAVSITDISGTNFRSGASVTLSGPTSGSGKAGTGLTTIEATDVKVLSYNKITCRFDLTGAPVGLYSLDVINSDGRKGGKENALTVTEPRYNWYLAEGTTAWGFNCYISIQNPNNAAVSVNVTYNTEGGAVSGGTINLPAMSQTTVNPADKLGQKDFSTLVTAPNGETIAVDRTMQWTGGGAGVGAGSSPEAHNSIGVTSPAKTWYLPEGSTSWGFETWLLIQNPNNAEAACSVTYMIEGADPVTLEKKVPANSRKSYNMASDIGEKDASIKVTSSVPVIPERAMYRNNRREGHDSIGTTSPATDFYLAEGAVGYDSGYITYVLVQNPQNEPNKVTVTYLTGSGEVAGPTIDMAPNSRKTIRVNDQLPPATDVSTRVHGEKPVIAERAMYWNSPAGEACHDSIGMDGPHRSFYLPDGQTSEGRETWTLVSNPNQIPVEVRISYLPAGGGTTISFTEILLPNSRKSYSMADKLPSGRASIMVESIMGGPVMVERAMYWSSRGAGTDTIGGYSD